ncbi:MAG: DNA polymerase/3'-5' exonuclease PolX [Anaerolineae bacterium]|nr:DNA polymerase/3'-5' exonuclease PolX [Anaerolineae bacterium]
MAVSNRDVADLFDRVADLLEIKGEIIHRVLSYRRAAESIYDLPRDLAAIAAENALTDIPGVGKTIAEKIEEILSTGKLAFYERLTAELPAGLVDVMRVNGVGPKKAKLFWEQLQVRDLASLEAAARAGKLRSLPKMGEKSEANILLGIEALARQTGRRPLGVAYPAAQALLDHLLTLPQAREGAIAGSIRRARPTIGDVDLLVAVDDMADAAPIMDAFVGQPQVARVLGHGPTKSSVELHNGLQVDLRVIEKARWGTALAYFTGSQQHNIRMRERALAQGYSLNEHALSPVDSAGTILDDAPKRLFDTEEALYAALGLPWVAPELREDSGELEAAERAALPRLITLADIQSDLHMHTVWSDGTATVREMAEAAHALGRKFIVITDHSVGATIANGLSVERLLRQQAEVRQVDAEMNGSIRVFHGTEMEIKADGTLDFPDEVLAQLDFVIASLHVSLRQPREQITARLLNAINNPHVDLIGHPRGQIIPDREPADLDMDAVFAAAQASGIALEINANPARLDLEAQYARRAVSLGIPLAIDTDAHSLNDLHLMHYGIRTARRGWVEAESVLNTWPLERFEAWVRARGKA